MPNKRPAGHIPNSPADPLASAFLSLKSVANSAAGRPAHIAHKPLNYNELLMLNGGHSNSKMGFFPDLREERTR
jgi:hypothetical protein